MNTVRGLALRGSVTGLRPRAVIVAETASIASVKIPAISCHLRSLDAEKLIDSAHGCDGCADAHVLETGERIDAASFAVKARSHEHDSSLDCSIGDGRETVVVAGLNSSFE